MVVINLIFLLVFLLIFLIGKQRVPKEMNAHVLSTIENTMGEIGKLERKCFPAGIYLRTVISKTSWIKSLFPESEPIDREWGLKEAMKAYGFAMSVFFGMLGAGFLLLIGGDGQMLLVYLAITVMAYFMPSSKLKKCMLLRDRMIRREFPKFLNQVILLLEAGYSTAMVWKHFGMAAQGKGAINKEIKRLSESYLAGKNEEELYLEMNKTLRAAIVSRFSSLCLQSLKKGSVDLISGLRELSAESWQERKWDALKMGEEASGKMILPLMLVFVGVLIIVMVPAVLQLMMI